MKRYLVAYLLPVVRQNPRSRLFTVYRWLIEYFQDRPDLFDFQQTSQTTPELPPANAINDAYRGLVVFHQCHTRDPPQRLKQLLGQLTVPVTFILDDLQVRPGNSSLDGLYRLASSFIATYPYRVQQYYPWIEPQQVVGVGHLPPVRYQADFDTPQVNRFLISGTVNSEYPVRSELVRLTRAKSKYPFDVLERYLAQPDYYRQINRYRFAFATPGAYGYILCKHLEIAYAGSVLLAHDSLTGELAELGFRHLKNCILYNLETLESTVAFCLDGDNSGLIGEIRKKGHELVSEIMASQVYQKRLDNHFKEH